MINIQKLLTFATYLENIIASGVQKDKYKVSSPLKTPSRYDLAVAWTLIKQLTNKQTILVGQMLFQMLVTN